MATVTLTDGDREMLPLILRQNKGFHLGCQWYLGAEPFGLQWAWHQIDCPNTSLIGGIASGKTSVVAMSYAMDCISIPYFGALNTAVTSTQAELVFDMVNGWIEGNDRMEHLIEDVSLRPFPTITFRNGSYWHFRTLGKDAKFIRGSEYDRINVDEAGLDYTGEAIKVLRGRLRGKVKETGRVRMARLDISGSPTDAPWLLERWERGVRGTKTEELNNYRSIRTTVYDNPHVTPEQIALMEADYSDEMIDVELKGLFPRYGMTTFSSQGIQMCTDVGLNDDMTNAIRPESGVVRPGWVSTEHSRHGIVHYEKPPEAGALYIMMGDPGTGDPPKRNAPCIMVARVDRKPWEIVYFNWIFGKGSYNPFLQHFKYCINLYGPIMKGIDATGTQKALEELAFENMGIATDKLQFQRDKDSMINSLIVAVTNGWFKWPVIPGLNKQMRHYVREDDKPAARVPQDIVMTLAGLAFLCRHLPDERAREVDRRRGLHQNRRARTTRNARRRTRR